MKIKKEAPVQNIELKVSSPIPKNSLREIFQSSNKCTTTTTIKSVEDNSVAKVLLDDNTPCSMAEIISVDRTNLDFKFEPLEIADEQAKDKVIAKTIR